MEVAEAAVWVKQILDSYFVILLLWMGGAKTEYSNYTCTHMKLHYLQHNSARDGNARRRHAQSMIKGDQKGYFAGMPSYLPKHNYHPQWHLLRHSVDNPRRLEKLCTALDCGTKHSGRSPQDILYLGSRTAENRSGILLRLRKERIAILSSVEENSMQVWVPDSNRRLRFLWWPEENLS